MPSIPTWALRRIRKWCAGQIGQAIQGERNEMLRLLDQALKPKRYVKLARARKRVKRGIRRGNVAAIRAAVWARSRGICECGCGAVFVYESNGELEHAIGGATRRTFESIEGCWRLRASCHRQKTNNFPSRNYWLEKFAAHCRKYGYARMAAEVEKRMEDEPEDAP